MHTQQPVSCVVMVSGWLVLIFVSAVSAQYYGNYWRRYGYQCPLPISPIAAGYITGFGGASSAVGMNIDPYNAANPYAMAGMIVDPAVSGMCVDTNMQCPIWASTGQCATNALVMRRMCALSCGTCGLGMDYGMGSSLGYGAGMGLGLGGYAIAPPMLGRSIYETGVLRSPTRTSIYPRSEKRDKLLPANMFLPERD